MPSLKSDEPTMTWLRAGGEQSRARSTVRTPPPTRQESSGAICRTIARLSPRAHRGVEIDDLHLRELLEPFHPAEDVVVADRELFALHELDDARRSEDRWTESACDVRACTGNAVPLQMKLSAWTLVSAK